MHRKNLVGLVEQYAATFPDKTMYIYDGKEMTAREIWDSVNRLAPALKNLGIEKGSHVLIMLPNCPDFVIAYFSILAIGAVVVPINNMLREAEVQFLMDNCEAKAIITDKACSNDVINAAGNIPTLKHILVIGEDVPPQTIAFQNLLTSHNPISSIQDVSSDDTAVIIYTSGHTGRPKGAQLSHKSLIHNAFEGVSLHQIRTRDCLAGVLPFCHVFGQTTVMNAALAACATVLLLPKFDPGQLLEAIERYRVTLLVGTPSLYNILLSYPERKKFNFATIRYCVSGGSKLKPELLLEFEKEFNTVICEGYGVTETTAVATFNHLHRERRPGSIGTPIESVEIKLLDETGVEVSCGEVGEIVIRTDYLMKGYLHRPESTREVIRNGWFYSGDLARADEEGFLYIVDRKTDMIVKGGFNIYPVEIERCLLAHPHIAEAAVIGILNEMHNEEVKACVVLKEGTNLSAEDAIEYCRQRMARYKCPKYVEFMKELPRNPLGRVSKKKLREMLASNSGK